MALFRYRGNKEGPGVDPDAPDRGPFIEFFANYFRKFWKITGAGILSVIGSLPGLILLYFAGFYLFQMVFPNFSYTNILEVISSMGYTYAEGVNAESFTSHLYLGSHFIFVMTIFLFQFFVVGPWHAGVTFLMRNYASERPVFFWSDLWDAFKTNWKQGLGHSLISSAILTLIIFSAYFYNNYLDPGILQYVILAVLFILLALAIIMNFYVYQMMVTFDLKLKDIYKNSLIIAMAKFPTSILIILSILILVAAIPFVVLWSFTSLGAAILIAIWLAILMSGFVLFLINFYAYRGIKKYMLDPMDDDDNDGAGSTVEQTEYEDRSEDHHYSEEIPEKPEDGEIPAGAPA